ncbi:Oidioi.mRNA.OKI2018_I69.chr2.g5797.t1.cds [Oikopleura dioica]|uniref:Oidioi.mRNA.OKI2018_I69.chr2.g5797.t1.cds n=1 Tax=Oikopleura dioica TaxID=34765 RepID=A0ABN7T4M7_OIKDI|nr:Oidioi.mRNA.OKI2018_I69.chr2.g5797.t1.cds [Oikopleura dioica]
MFDPFSNLQKNLQEAIGQFIKTTQEDVKKRNMDKHIATVCAQKFLDRANKSDNFNGKSEEAGVLAEEFGRAAVESINALRDFQAAMMKLTELIAE